MARRAQPSTHWPSNPLGSVTSLACSICETPRRMINMNTRLPELARIPSQKVCLNAFMWVLKVVSSFGNPREFLQIISRSSVRHASVRIWPYLCATSYQMTIVFILSSATWLEWQAWFFQDFCFISWKIWPTAWLLLLRMCSGPQTHFVPRVRNSQKSDKHHAAEQFFCSTYFEGKCRMGHRNINSLLRCHVVVILRDQFLSKLPISNLSGLQ